MDQDTYARIARHAALSETAGLRAALSALGDDPKEVGATLRRHHLLGPVRRLLGREAAHIPGTTRHADPEVLLGAFEEVRDALTVEAVPLLLLKGPVLAQRLYGGIDRRPQQDLDVLCRGADARRARAAVKRLGYARHARDLHSVTLRRGAVKVDLHHALRATPAYAADEAAVWGTTVDVAVGGLRVRTLSDDYAITLLATGLAEDAGFGMAKLKQVVDLWLLARDIDATFDWQGCFERRRREHLEAMTVNGCVLALLALDAAAELPRLATALETWSEVVRVRDRAHALGLLVAPRSDPANMAWLGEVYPGSLARWAVVQWLARLPHSLRDLRPSQVGRYVAVRRERRPAPDGRPSE